MKLLLIHLWLSGRPGIFYLLQQVKRLPWSVLAKDLCYLTVKSNNLSFLIRTSNKLSLKKSNSLSLCNTKKQHLSICIFLDKVLFLESPVSTSKRFENSPVSVKSKIRKSDSPASRRLPQLLLPTNSMFPGKCNSQEQLSDRRI